MMSRTEFAKLVAEELARARSVIPPINSFHEGYGVIYEELCEFFDEVRKKRRDRDPAKLLAELVQVAAMCQRTAEDRGLMGGGQAIPGEDAKVDEVDEVDGQHGQPSPTPPPGGEAATPPKEEGRVGIVGSLRDSEGWAHVTDDGRLRDKVDTHFDERSDLHERLTIDPQISEDSPVIKGTWVTVNQIVSMIVDGYSWEHIIRVYHELTEDDIRAALAFKVQEDERR